MAKKWFQLTAVIALSCGLAVQALAADEKITVFAAASLTNAMQDIAARYKKEKQVDVVSSFASSSTLARQIEAGAPADLFISADQKGMDYANDKKSIDAASRKT
ncbi:molybdate ABC transporter substrate-binding protein, partial [Atlantibacter hermannii]|uniref:molybdate ABC transporter substrate-binding protein n=1 Tax=Atlantibacter hermannii TaxID=565 RepID=UPI0028AE649E